MGGQKKPKGALRAPPWPNVEFQLDPILQHHARNLLKEVIKVEEVAIEADQSLPMELFGRLVQAMKDVLQKVKDKPSVLSMTQELQEIYSILQN